MGLSEVDRDSQVENNNRDGDKNMKTKDWLTITSVALGTAALTVVTFWPGPMDAGVEAEGPAIKIAQPKLDCDGLELSVTHPGGEPIKAGDRPNFELTAMNKSEGTKTAKFAVRMTAVSAANMLSRVPRMPLVLWQQDQILTLKAGETRVVSLNTTNVPANNQVTVVLSTVNQGIASFADRWVNAPVLPQSIGAFTFSTMVPGPAPSAGKNNPPSFQRVTAL